jgi:hypothetical protein
MSLGTVVSPIPNKTLAERLKRRLIRQPNGCLEWAGYICSQTGYGKIANTPGAPISVHVAVWIVQVGPVPAGLVVRHKCDNRACGDIDHLLVGTQADNVRDMVSRGRTNNYVENKVCPAGHKYDEQDSEGFRGCSVCRLRRARKASLQRRIARGKVPLGSYCHGCWFLSTRCQCRTLLLGNHLLGIESHTT